MKYPYDLARFRGIDNESVVIRVTAEGHRGDDGTLYEYRGKFRVGGLYLRGESRTYIGYPDLEEWQGFLDLLDVGHAAAWRLGARCTELEATPECGDRFWLKIADPTFPGVVLRVLVILDDSWFDDAYRRLDRLIDHARG